MTFLTLVTIATAPARSIGLFAHTHTRNVAGSQLIEAGPTETISEPSAKRMTSCPQTLRVS